MADSQTTTIEATSVIRKVTLYENRAQIHRFSKTVLTDAECEVVYEDIPSDVNRDSLQVTISSSGNGPAVTFKGVVFDTKTVKHVPTTEEEQKKAKAADRLLEISKELKAIDDRISAAEAEANFVASAFGAAVATTSEQDKDDYDVSRWESLIETRVKAQEKLQIEKRSLASDQAALKAEQKELRPIAMKDFMRSDTKTVAKVLVGSAEPAGTVEIAISYMVDLAGWKPLYEMRVNSETGVVRVGYNAEVHQYTGDKWEDVEIELSTAKPGLAGKQPELTPWRLSLAPKAVQHSMRSKGAMKKRAAPAWGHSGGYQLDEQAEEVFIDDDESLDTESMVTDSTFAVQEATIDEAATAVTFNVPGKHNVDPAGDPARVPIADFELTSTLRYTAVPGQLESAFAVAVAKNVSKFLLVAGDANVFLNGHFVTKTTQKRCAPNEDFEVGVGADESIVLKHKRISRVVSQEGNIVTGKKSQVAYTYLITATSHKKGKVTLTVKDQVPVSNDSEVTVHVTEPKVKPDDDGLFEVKLELEEGKKKELRIAFEITHPRDDPIYGAN